MCGRVRSCAVSTAEIGLDSPGVESNERLDEQDEDDEARETQRSVPCSGICIDDDDGGDDGDDDDEEEERNMRAHTSVVA